MSPFNQIGAVSPLEQNPLEPHNEYFFKLLNKVVKYSKYKKFQSQESVIPLELMIVVWAWIVFGLNSERKEINKNNLNNSVIKD